MTPTVVLITKNEEKNIANCLTSIPSHWAIHIIDSGSTDNTAKIAKSFNNVTFTHQEWLGFGRQKQYAVDSTSGGWILNLDADEILSEPLIQEIENLSSKPSSLAYKIPRQSHFKNTKIRFSGWRPDYVIRLFHTKFCAYNDNIVHESVTGFTKLQTLKSNIIHFPYPDDKTIAKKIRLYGHLAQRQRIESQHHQSKIYAGLRCGWAFIRTYLLRLGFLDGPAGFNISLMNARVTFIKYSKKKI